MRNGVLQPRRLTLSNPTSAYLAALDPRKPLSPNVGVGFMEAAAKLPPKTGGSSKKLTICNLRSSLIRIKAEFSIFYPYFWRANKCLLTVFVKKIFGSSLDKPHPYGGRVLQSL